MRQHAVEQNYIGGDLQQLVAPRVVGALCRGDQQAEVQRRHRRDQRDPQLHDILRIRAQMMPGQYAVHKDGEQGLVTGIRIERRRGRLP